MEQADLTRRYSVEKGHWTGEPVLTLYDHESGAEAAIAPGLGANCVAWAITHNGQRLEILETPPTADDLRSRRFRAGIPVLWPFPGRVREAQYSFAGHTHHLPRTDKGGIHHIHGLVVAAPWRVAGSGPGEEGAQVTFTVGPADLDEAMREGYPFDFALNLQFTLSGTRLTIDLQVENHETSRELPFDYGLHPYFRAPLLPSATTPDRTACPVLLPTATRWPATEGLPTAAPQPVSPEEDFRQWRPLGPQHFDHMFSGASYQDGWTIAGYRDPGAGLEVLVKADHNFREWVLFTQPNRPSVCIEPYTSPPNAINLEAEGITPDSGLVRLAPGASWKARVVLEVNSYSQP